MYALSPSKQIHVLILESVLDTTSIPVVQINRVMHVANDKMAACVNDGRLTRLSEKDLETISDCFKTGITDVLHEQLNGSSSPRETSPTLSLTNPPLDIQTHNLNVPSQPPTTVPATVSGTLSYPGNSRCGSPAGTLVPSQIYPGQISNGVSTDDFSTSLPSPGAEKDTTVWELFPDFVCDGFVGYESCSASFPLHFSDLLWDLLEEVVSSQVSGFYSIICSYWDYFPNSARYWAASK